MPYRRNYKKKPGPLKKRAQIYGRAGYQLYKDVMYLKTLVNSEGHYHDKTQTYNMDNSGTVSSLNDIIQGDTEFNRTGNSVLPRYQSINIHIGKSLAGPDNEAVRLILFRYWGEATSGAPNVSVTEVLQQASPQSMLNQDNTGGVGDRSRRIQILKSKFFMLNNVANTNKAYKWNVQVNGLNQRIKEHIQFRSSTTEQPISGGFYLLSVTNNGTAANFTSLSYFSRLMFHDN